MDRVERKTAHANVDRGERQGVGVDSGTIAHRARHWAEHQARPHRPAKVESSAADCAQGVVATGCIDSIRTWNQRATIVVNVVEHKPY